jgi:hypothetical protein
MPTKLDFQRHNDVEIERHHIQQVLSNRRILFPCSSAPGLVERLPVVSAGISMLTVHIRRAFSVRCSVLLKTSIKVLRKVVGHRGAWAFVSEVSVEWRGAGSQKRAKARCDTQR